MERKKWLYLALILLIIGIASMILIYPVMRYGGENPILFITFALLTAIGWIGAALCLFWWAILKRTESIGKSSRKSRF